MEDGRHIDLEAQLRAFNAKQAEEMAGFLAKLKKEEEEASGRGGTFSGEPRGGRSP
eukprot:SAG22_NODE_2341_length_2687_cov_4.174652_2_plen_56_part_00